MSPDAALVACRFLHDALLMLLWGGSAYIAAFVPRNLGRDLGRRLCLFNIVAAVVAAVTTVLFLPLEAALIGEGWSDALDPATIRGVLFDTSVGHAWLFQAVAAFVLIVVVLLCRGRSKAALAIAAGLLLAGVSLTGHAVMQAGWPGVAHQINDAIHVLSAGAWLGALVPLQLILKALDDEDYRREADLALRRFSTAGHLAVALVIASGMINTLLVLGRWPTDWSSPYQALLAAKIALVAVMAGLAVVNRYVFVPRMSRDRSATAHSIRVGTMVEILVALGVVGLVSIFGMLDPA